MRAAALLLHLGSPILILGCGGGDLLLPGSGAPAELRLVSGDLQQAETGVTLPQPLVVEVRDGTGRPVPESRILFRFEAATAGAQVNPDTALTNESGRAAAEVRLGQEPGGHPVEAVVVDGSSDLRVRFLLTALTPSDPGPIGGGGGGGGEEDDGQGGGEDDNGNGDGGNDDGGGDSDREDDGEDDDRDVDDGDGNDDDNHDEDHDKEDDEDKDNGKGKEKD